MAVERGRSLYALLFHAIMPCGRDNSSICWRKWHGSLHFQDRRRITSPARQPRRRQYSQSAAQSCKLSTTNHRTKIARQQFHRHTATIQLFSSLHPTHVHSFHNGEPQPTRRRGITISRQAGGRAVRTFRAPLDKLCAILEEFLRDLFQFLECFGHV